MAAVGETLFIDCGPVGQHLYVVIAGPIEVPFRATGQQMISVGITTLYPGAPHDAGCLLNVGDHPFVQHASYVRYRDIRVDPSTHLDGMRAPRHQAASPALVQRILAGLCQSRTVDRRFKALLNCPAAPAA